MSEDKKPKKDLRARLGRTIAPNTPGAPPIAAPGGVIAPPAAPAAAAPRAAAAAPVANPYSDAPIAAPPAMAPPSTRTPFGPDIAPPPFARPAAAPAQAPRPERRRPVDPFAAQAATNTDVRLIIDEKPIDTSAAGRARTINGVIIAVSIAAGLVLGAFGGSANGDRGLYNISVRDGQSVNAALVTAADAVTQAQTHLDAIAASASGDANHHPSVNYEEIAALNAIELPLSAGVFSRKNYNRFDAATVDDLFNYDHNVHELWDDFTHLSGITSGPARRATLDATAAATTCPADLGHDAASATAAMSAASAATTDQAHAQYVALLQTTDDGTVQGTLGFAETDFDTTTHQPTGRTFMRADRVGPGRAFDRWVAGSTIGGTGAFVMPIDGPASSNVLGDRDGSFRTFADSLEQTRALLRSTLVIQGRLTTALGLINALPEQFAL